MTPDNFIPDGTLTFWAELDRLDDAHARFRAGESAMFTMRRGDWESCGRPCTLRIPVLPGQP